MGNYDRNGIGGIGDDNRHRKGRKCCGQVSPIEEIVHPTQTVYNKTTNRRTVRNIHPIDVVNINRTVIRNENYFPVSQSNVNETVVEEYNCGGDVNNPVCRPVRRNF